jgi:hypothetical protein
VAHKLSSNLTPKMLNPALNPARQQQQQAQGLAGLASLPQVQPGMQQLPPQFLQQQGMQQLGVPAADATGALGVDGQLQQQKPQQAAH